MFLLDLITTYNSANMSISMLRFAKHLHVWVNSFEVGLYSPVYKCSGLFYLHSTMSTTLIHIHTDILNKCKHTAIEKCYIRFNDTCPCSLNAVLGSTRALSTHWDSPLCSRRSDFHSHAFVWNTENMINLFTLTSNLTVLILMSLHVQCQMVRSAERSVAMPTFKWLCASMLPEVAS